GDRNDETGPGAAFRRARRRGRLRPHGQARGPVPRGARGGVGAQRVLRRPPPLRVRVRGGGRGGGARGLPLRRSGHRAGGGGDGGRGLRLTRGPRADRGASPTLPRIGAVVAQVVGADRRVERALHDDDRHRGAPQGSGSGTGTPRSAATLRAAVTERADREPLVSSPAISRT